MDYPCLSSRGLRGFRHELLQCSGCNSSYCSCLKTDLECCFCKSKFCSNCLSRLEKMKLCSCVICIGCLNICVPFEEHGRNCKQFRKNFKWLLYCSRQGKNLQRMMFIPDIIDYISEFLWSSEMC